MLEEPSENKEFDRSFEQDRNAEPVMAEEKEADLIQNKVQVSPLRNKRNRHAFFAGILSLILLVATLKVYNPFKEPDSVDTENSSDPITKSTSEMVEVADDKELHELQGTVTGETEKFWNFKKNVFPPVYKDENISRPEVSVIKKITDNVFSTEKISIQTDGFATINFSTDDQDVKMLLHFGEVKSLSINKKMIDPGAYPDYAKIIDTGIQLEKNSRTNKEEQTGLSDLDREKKRQNEIIMNSIIKSVARDALIADGQSCDFRLQWNNLTINNEPQPNELYEKYKALYEEASGKKLNARSNIHIAH